jgi:anti-sigma factor RsiW
MPSTIRSLSLAAVLVLIAGGVLLYSLTGLSPTVLAAQLALDHAKCFAVDAADTPVDANASEERYAREYGQQIHLPRPAVAGLQLVGLRRCYCGEGAAAHVMYRLNGQPVSLYMIPDASRARASAEIFGYDAVIWSKQDMTYVLVSREPRATLQELALALGGGV